MMKRLYGRALGISLGIILIGCFALAWGWVEYAQAEENGLQPVGKIERTQGATMVMRAGTTDFVPISKGEPVFVQDTIGTAPNDPNAKMWWRHPSPVLMDASLGRDSLLGFESYSQEGPSSSFVGSVSRGMVRLIRKVPVTQPESSFTTISPTALVQVIPGGDRAADYVVSVLDDEHTSVTVIWGAVAVRNVSDQTTQIREVTSCQTVMVEKDKEPSEVMPVGSDALRELIDLTTIPGTLPTNVPSCTPPSEPVPPDQYIPPEPPEVIEMLPGEPGVEFGPPGFIPIPPGDGYTGTIDTTDTTPTDTTPTDTTPTDTTPTITIPTITFPTITFPTITFPPPTFTITFDPPTFTFTFPPTLIDTSVIDTGTGIGTFTFSPTLIDTSVIDTGTGVIGYFHILSDADRHIGDRHRDGDRYHHILSDVYRYRDRDLDSVHRLHWLYRWDWTAFYPYFFHGFSANYARNAGVSDPYFFHRLSANDARPQTGAVEHTAPTTAEPPAVPRTGTVEAAVPEVIRP